MAYVESVGLIVSLFCLPLLGFLLGKHSTAARLTGEQNRADELRNIHTLIENNRNDAAEQVRSIYDEIKQHQDENSRQLQGVSTDVWTKLQEVDKELGLASSGRPLYQTTTTA